MIQIQNKKRDRATFKASQQANVIAMDCSDDSVPTFDEGSIVIFGPFGPSGPSDPVFAFEQDSYSKKTMYRQDPARFTKHLPLDLTIVNHKIQEVHELLEELYKMRDYFESQNSKNQDRCSYFC